jgi:hypothetical protein
MNNDFDYDLVEIFDRHMQREQPDEYIPLCEKRLEFFDEQLKESLL